jgi:hypothetical protein
MRNRFGRLTHGHNRVGKQTPEYRAWRGIVQRCCNPNAENYKRFGGNGVELDPRWRKFDNFLKDVGTKPSPKHSIGRIFDLPRYAKDFAVWQTQRQQSLHKMSRHFFEGKVTGWSSRKLNAVVKFITNVIAGLPDTEPTDFQVLELLYARPNATLERRAA